MGFDYKTFIELYDEGHFIYLKRHGLFTYKIGDTEEGGMYGLQTDSAHVIHWFYAFSDEGFRYYISFEELLELMPEKIKTELLFHLDLFRSS